jgi:CRP-like cAMP-binding protein
MSLLTGQARSATVTACGDCQVLEIAVEDFRSYVQTHPEVIDHLAISAAIRQQELDQVRAIAPTDSSIVRLTLAARMRKFFGLD